MKNVMKERKVVVFWQRKNTSFTDFNFLQVLENKRLDLDASKSKVKKSRKDIMEQRPVSTKDMLLSSWLLNTCVSLVCCCVLVLLCLFVCFYLNRSDGILLGPSPIRSTLAQQHNTLSDNFSSMEQCWDNTQSRPISGFMIEYGRSEDNNPNRISILHETSSKTLYKQYHIWIATLCLFWGLPWRFVLPSV